MPKEDNRSGFWIHESTRVMGTWSADATGPNGWFVDGFKSRRHALDWTLGYLTRIHENNTRIGLDELERRRESDARIAAMNAAVLERPVEKGKEN
jgi:hypothetical protein